jgi:hypothetical protein
MPLSNNFNISGTGYPKAVSSSAISDPYIIQLWYASDFLMTSGQSEAIFKVVPQNYSASSLFYNLGLYYITLDVDIKVYPSNAGAFTLTQFYYYVTGNQLRSGTSDTVNLFTITPNNIYVAIPYNPMYFGVGGLGNGSASNNIANGLNFKMEFILPIYFHVTLIQIWFNLLFSTTTAHGPMFTLNSYKIVKIQSISN